MTGVALANDSLINEVIFRGAKLRADVSEVITSASIDLSADQVSEIRLELEDPDFDILRDGYIKLNTLVDYQDLKHQIAALETTDGDSGRGGLSITCRPAAVQKLKARRGPMVLKNISPSEFIARECESVGAKYFVEPSAKRKQIARDVVKAGEAVGNEAPSTWTTFTRLADELGFMLFEVGSEAGSVIYFGRPSYFMKTAPTSNDPTRFVRAYWNVGEEFYRTRTPPKVRASVDSTDGITVDVELAMERSEECRPGRVLVLRGVPGFDANYFITSVNFELAGVGTVSVSAKTPIDPDPNPPEATTTTTKTVGLNGKVTPGKSTSTTPDTSGRRDKGSVDDFVYQALKQAGDRYIFGAEARKSDADPNVFDCSELVEWACAQVGVNIPDGSGNQRNFCWSKGGKISTEQAIRTRGALLFANGHVAISLGNGKTIEAVNRSYGVRIMNARGRSSVSWIGGGLIPGMRY